MLAYSPLSQVEWSILIGLISSVLYYILVLIEIFKARHKVFSAIRDELNNILIFAKKRVFIKFAKHL